MPESAYLALFIVGLLGGTHCVGMCGGIVGALSFGGPPRLSLHLSYNLGRIASYGIAGALAGGLGAASLHLSAQLPLRLALATLANLLLIALGFYLAGETRLLLPLERAGARLWRHIEPLARRFLPARTFAQALPLGLLWGWLPCGMVYSALATALTAGSALQGGLLMLAFGAGTLPNLLLAGFFLARLRRFTQQRLLRRLAGLLVAGFGVHGLISVWRLAGG